MLETENKKQYFLLLLSIFFYSDKIEADLYTYTYKYKLIKHLQTFTKIHDFTKRSIYINILKIVYNNIYRFITYSFKTKMWQNQF